VDPATRRYTADDGPEFELPRGDVTEGVVRAGGTVRRPHQPQSLAVAGYLDHLERAGFDAAPRYLGRDDRGRDVLTYLDGDVPGDPPEPRYAAPELLASVGRLVRRLHEASAGYGAERGFAAPEGSVWGRDLVRVETPEPASPPELITHNDVTPQNVVVRDGEAAGLVDFDLAGPSTRLLDVWNTATHWVPMRAPADVWPTWAGVDQAARLRVLADGYGLTAAERATIVDLGIVRTDVSWRRMRAAAEQLGGGWARMWEAGVGDAIRRRERWLAEQRDALTAALLDGGSGAAAGVAPSGG
jgi:Ser/Thr protein kinase RdoA (MazF antagonist)